MPTRVHVHLKVKDLERSRAFYEHFFGGAPVKVKADQIKFLPSWAPVNLALSVAHRGEAPGGFVNHLGVEVDSGEAVMTHLLRVKAAGIATREQLNVNCCYANQSKFWVIDPDGVEWEIYHVNHDLVEKHGGGVDQINVPAS
ncbi:MAG TPA: ArsI/CadI family heavy metal resistance metalloenzyme [Candidatus Binataceae bacterium]|nr:ArsI/CadI family heavy metal resistance metalloenzyme [Candidatus Binataceae bacterium]